MAMPHGSPEYLSIGQVCGMFFPNKQVDLVINEASMH